MKSAASRLAAVKPAASMAEATATIGDAVAHLR